jgi:hypothetical protein
MRDIPLDELIAQGASCNGAKHCSDVIPPAVYVNNKRKLTYKRNIFWCSNADIRMRKYSDFSYTEQNAL